MKTQERTKAAFEEPAPYAPAARPPTPGELTNAGPADSAQAEPAKRHARGLMRAAVAVFLLMSVLQLGVFGRWVTALFHAATAFLFLARGGIDNWRKPARYLFIVLYVALAVATFVEIGLQAKLF
ncbi:MAG TPA: hypothetical protein VN282_27735 [Pyrinomonadaceae bacterium]|nr:hypothetical protein [Pyrinomonadaceae bacterium]